MNMKRYFYKDSSEVQALINSKGYKNRRELREEFPGLFYKCYDNGWMKDLVFPDDSTRMSWKDIGSSVESAQEFIDSNPELTSKEVLQKKHSRLYAILRSKNFLNQIKFKKGYDGGYTSWKSINSLEDFSEFIFTNSVESRGELLKRFPGLYSKFIRERWGENFAFEKDRNSWQSMSIEEIQEFIDSRPELINMESLYINGYSGLRCYLVKNKLVDKISFKSTRKSSWETKLAKVLEEAGINSKIDSIASYSNWSRLDLKIDGYNIAVEIQGPYHWKEFNPHNFQKVRKSDIKKHRWGIKNGVKIFYFTYIDKYLKFGYPYYVYTSEKELIADILKEISNQTNNTSNGNES